MRVDILILFLIFKEHFQLVTFNNDDISCEFVICAFIMLR